MYVWFVFGLRLVYVWFVFGFNVVHVWFMFGLCLAYGWHNVGHVGLSFRFMVGIMLFQRWCILGAFALFVFWCVVGSCLVYVGFISDCTRLDSMYG